MSSQLLFINGGSYHLIEGVVFAFAGWYDVHGGGADLVLLEAGLEEMGHLRLLRIIDRVDQRKLACGLVCLYSWLILTLKLSQHVIQVSYDPAGDMTSML